MNDTQRTAMQDYRTTTELIPAHWTSHQITVSDGAVIHALRTGGSKPPLVLLHGVQGSGLYWLRTAQALEDDYDVILPDTRGHGRSSPAGEGYTLPRLVADLHELFAALGIERPALVGHSMGADIAGHYAARHPVAALVLVDPPQQRYPVKFDLDAPPSWLAPILNALTALKTQTHAERLVTAQALLPPGSAPYGEADYVGLVEGMAQFDIKVYRYTQALGYLFEDPAVIGRITAPTLLITARSAMVPDAAPNTLPFLTHLSDGQHAHYPEAGHFIMFDAFDRFIADLRAFLAPRYGHGSA